MFVTPETDVRNRDSSVVSGGSPGGVVPQEGDTVDLSEVVLDSIDAETQHTDNVDVSMDSNGSVGTRAEGLEVGESDVHLSVGRPKRACSKPKWMRTGEYVVDG